jgi:hypothetical protein
MLPLLRRRRSEKVDLITFEMNLNGGSSPPCSSRADRDLSTDHAQAVPEAVTFRIDVSDPSRQLRLGYRDL